MARNVADAGGELLVVSQFTLYGEFRKGTRLDFSAAMPTETAGRFYAEWLAFLRRSCALRIAEGIFAAKMRVALVNDGPITLMLDSRRNQ